MVVYWAPFTEQGWVDALSYINTDRMNDPSVLSISYCFPELVPTNELQTGEWEWTQQAIQLITSAFLMSAAIHMTVLVSSGDDGSNCFVNDGNAHVMYPTSDPGVIACGGTMIKTLSPLSEETWGGTGGGISYLVPPQPWQANANLPPSANHDGHLGRGVPDVAGNASLASGYFLWLYGQSTAYLKYTAGSLKGQAFGPAGGTSAVAPLYAALIALINASLNTRVGYLNPTLYSLGGSDVFRDIKDGESNRTIVHIPGKDNMLAPGYTSAAGWDACTGWGSIDGTKLLEAFTITGFKASWNHGYTGVTLSWSQGPETPSTTFQLHRYTGEFSPSVTPQATEIPISSPYTDTPSDIFASSQYQYRLVFSNAFG